MSEIDHDALPYDLAPGDRARWDELGAARQRLPVAGQPVSDHAALTNAVHAWLEGRSPQPPREMAQDLGYEMPLRHTGERPEVANRVISDEMLADVAEDWLPDIGMVGERITGDPWAPLTVPVAAALAGVPGLCKGRRVLDQWGKDCGDRGIRQALRVIGLAAPVVCSDGLALYRVSPFLGETRADLPVPPTPHGVGRPYRVPGGWAWSAWIGLPNPIEAGPLRRRLRAAAWLRSTGPGQTVEELLRAVPDVVYRAAHEGSWRSGVR